jgi:uncharacterized protein
LRIAPAKSLEGAVPDLAARQIIANQIGPGFKRGDYAAGLNAGVDALMARIRGENLPAPTQQGGARPDAGFDWEELAVFFFIAVPVLGEQLDPVTVGFSLAVIAVVFVSRRMAVGQPAGR